MLASSLFFKLQCSDWWKQIRVTELPKLRRCIQKTSASPLW